MSDPSKGRKLLVVDDEESLRMILRETLEPEGFVVTTARDGDEALQIVETERIDVVLSDIRMPGMSGLELLAETKKRNPKIQFIIMTSHASLETSMEAIRLGAYDYILKPFQDLNAVIQMVRRACEQLRMREENEDLIRSLKSANTQLSESNELLASRAQTIAALLDYSQAHAGILSGEKFGTETARASSKLAGGRPCVVYRLHQAPAELAPLAWEGAKAARALAGPQGDVHETGIRAWIADLEKTGELARTSLDPPASSAYVSAITSGSATSHVVAVFETGGPFPPSVRAILDKFMHQVQVTAENVALHDSMRSLAIRDGLTGLYNHRYFQDRFIEEFARAKRHKHPLSLIFVDIDHFKKFNDMHGHPRGDALLRGVSRLIKSTGRLSDVAARGPEAAGQPVVLPHSRESDIVARYGGEEFVLILTETAFEGALIRAERLRKAIEDASFSFSQGGTGLKVTVSVGVAALQAEHKKADEIVREADQAMYAAKRGGRNRVCTRADVEDANTGSVKA